MAVARVDVDVGCAVVGAAADELEQEPKAGLHPEPQYAFDEPQYPYCEQQLPNTDFKHVEPLFPPQDPSFDTFRDTAIGAADVIQVQKADWHPAPQWAEVLPQ